MAKFTKITTKNEDGSYLRTWIDQEYIHKVSQHSHTQAGNNEGTLEFTDGEVIDIVTFNETLDSLN
jgi:hypothetical protein